MASSSSGLLSIAVALGILAVGAAMRGPAEPPQIAAIRQRVRSSGLLSVVVTLGILAVGAAMKGPAEPPQIAAIRQRVRVLDSPPDYGATVQLDWVVVRSLENIHGQGVKTVTYALVPPGKDLSGDIQGVVEIYNPQGTTVNNATEFIVEYTRLAWWPQTVMVGTSTWLMPNVGADSVVMPGYLTLRVPVI